MALIEWRIEEVEVRPTHEKYADGLVVERLMTLSPRAWRRWDAFRLVAIGVVVGVRLARCRALLQSQPHSVGPTDRISFGLTVGVLSMATLLAAALPGARASRVSPMSALKHE